MPRMTFTNLLGSDIPVGNATGYGKSFTIPAAGCVVDFTGVQLESSQVQLDLAKSKGWISWVKAQSPSMSDELEILAGSPSTGTIVPATVVAAKSATAVHASVLATAANLFPGPITNPGVPRNLSAVSAAGYDGGILTIVGTNQFDVAQTETITPNPAGGTVYGVKTWKTVTSITKATIGVAAFGVSVGTGDKIGVPYNIVDGTALLFRGTVIEAVTIDVTNDSYTPATPPAGETFILVCSVNP